jgi:hypothetical protein
MLQHALTCNHRHLTQFLLVWTTGSVVSDSNKFHSGMLIHSTDLNYMCASYSFVRKITNTSKGTTVGIVFNPLKHNNIPPMDIYGFCIILVINSGYSPKQH